MIDIIIQKELVMEQFTFLNNRNKLFLFLYIVGNIVYSLAVLTTIFPFFTHLPYIGLLFCLLFLGLYLTKIPPQFMQWILLIGSNISILIFNYLHCHYIGITWFVLFILMASVYESLAINITISIVAITESVILLKILPQNVLIDITSTYYLLFTLALMTLLAWLQFYLLKRSWRSMEVLHDSKEKQMAWSDAYLHLFFNSAKDSIAVFDLEGRIIQVNRAFEDLYGWTRKECIGQKLPLVPKENAFDAEIRRQGLMRGESYQLIETCDQRKDGSYFEAQISLSPILNEQGEVTATSLISRDISYLKENERLLRETEKLNLAGELAAGLAHEIRNPMTVLSGFVQMMSSDTNSPYYDQFSIMQKEIERIDLIVEEFLILSKPQARVPENFYLDDVLRETEEFLTHSFDKHKIDFSISWEAHQKQISGSENQVKQVLLNLIKNAIEALQDMPQREISIRFFEQKNMIAISITDTGVGMDEETLQHIFSPFYTTKQTGTGLGMIITNKIMQEHGGTITIDSKANVGTTVTIAFPYQ